MTVACGDTRRFYDIEARCGKPVGHEGDHSDGDWDWDDDGHLTM